MLLNKANETVDLTDRVIAPRSITEIHPDEANKNAALAEQLKVRAETEDKQSPTSYHLSKRMLSSSQSTHLGVEGPGCTCIAGSASISLPFIHCPLGR